MDNLGNFIKGIVLGVSNVIPGVSAATLAVVMNIYDNLLEAISNLFKDFKKNFKFLFFILLGIGVGIVFFSYIIEKLIGIYPWQVNYLFMGLIAGSFSTLFKTAKSYNPKTNHYIYFIITFVLLIAIKYLDIGLVGSVIAELNIKNLIILFFGGFIASCALIIPGVSGAFILILLGLYNSIISAVSNFNILVLIPFGIGVLCGLVLMSKCIKYLLNKYTPQTYVGILGFVVGSVFSIFPGFSFSLLGLSCIVIFLIGYFVSYSIFKNSKK